MLITTFVFIGIEGASVYSRYAKRREDVGKATVMGFLSVLSIFALVTLSSYAVVPQPELAAARQPSMVGVFESVVGHWGEIFISVARHRLRARRLPRLDADGGRGHVHPRAQDDFPEFLGRENEAGTPITALVVTSLAVQGLLALTLFVSDALNFMLDLSTSLALLPYLLAAAYALKLGLTGETYEASGRHPAQGDDRRGRRDGVHDLPLRRGRHEVRAADDRASSRRPRCSTSRPAASTAGASSRRPRSGSSR